MLVFILAVGCSGKTEPEDTIENKTEQKNEVEVDEPVVLHKTENNLTILIGAETFTELTGNGGFIDSADEGHEYLVVYLEMANRKSEDDYIHYDFFSTEVDGQNINNTFLMNKPKDYETILTSIPAETEKQGYLAYKVPVGWEKVSVIYTGWGTEEGQILRFELTQEDLKEVAPLDQ